MGVSFQDRNHCSGDRGTAPKSDIIMVAAPQRKVAGTTWLLCASPGNPKNAGMGAVRSSGVIPVAVLKSDPPAPVKGCHSSSAPWAMASDEGGAFLHVLVKTKDFS